MEWSYSSNKGSKGQLKYQREGGGGFQSWEKGRGGRVTEAHLLSPLKKGDRYLITHSTVEPRHNHPTQWWECKKYTKYIWACIEKSHSIYTVVQRLRNGCMGMKHEMCVHLLTSQRPFLASSVQLSYGHAAWEHKTSSQNIYTQTYS